MARRWIAAVTIVAMVTGCARTWPHPVAVVDARLLDHSVAVNRIDILPVDVALWTDGRRGDPVPLRRDAEATILAAATTAMYQRGYLPAATIAWDGSAMQPGGNPAVALSPSDLLTTVQVLSDYHGAATRLGGLPQPPLPARLGASGAEATLYIGGWSYVGDDGDGNRAMKVLVIAAIAIVVVVVVLALLDGKGKSAGSGLGHASGAVAQAALATGRIALRTVARAGNVAVEIGRVSFRLADHMSRAFPGRVVPRTIDPDFDLYVSPRSSYGPPAWQRSAPMPDWGQRANLPHHGRSALYLEMTLIDNRDGHVLWHVASRFPASGGRRHDVERAAEILLSTLPAAR
jgi:hypothetical protein